jgi:hypothetical protein
MIKRKGEGPLYKSDKGAASVLVIFMMIILVTFGTLSLSAALANVRLGSKAVGWMTDYYELDAQAEFFCMEADAYLLSAERRAAPFLSESNYAEVYYLEARDALEDMAAGWLDMEISGAENAVQVEMLFSKGSEPGDQNLTVVLGLAKPEFQLVQGVGGQASWRRGNGFLKRYSVLKWQQWQVPFAQDGNLELWDGIIPV